MNLEKKCEECKNPTENHIREVERIERGYYIFYMCGDKDFISDLRLREQERLGIGTLVEGDYRRLAGE